MKALSGSKTQTVAINIRKLREQRNYTQEYMAANLKISQNAYSKIELGYTKITVDRLFELADILRANVVDLLYPNQTEAVQLEVNTH